MFGSLNENKMIREAKEQGRLVSPFGQILTFFIMHIAVTFVMQFAITPVLYIRIMTDEDFIKVAKTYDIDKVMEWFSGFYLNMPEYIRILSVFASVFFFVAAVIYCTKYIRRSLASMGFRKEGAVKETLMGALFAVVTAALVLSLLLLTGAVKYNCVQKVNVFAVIAYFFAFAVQGFSEEAFVRGCFMINSTKSSPVFYALVMSSMLFAYMHSASAGYGLLGYVNSFLFGLALGVLFLRRGSIWGIGAFHATWNFIECTLLGSNVNGVAAETSVFSFKLTEGFDNLSGGVMGTENGLAFTLVCFLALGAFMLMRPKASEYVETIEENNREEM